MAGRQNLGRTNLKEILFYLGLQIVIKQGYNGLLKKHCKHKLSTKFTAKALKGLKENKNN